MNHLPLKFKTALQKRGWSQELYVPIYDKCATFQALTGEEHYRAMHLHEIGFMTVTRTPIWKGDSYAGMKVEFQSYVPV